MSAVQICTAPVPLNGYQQLFTRCCALQSQHALCQVKAVEPGAVVVTQHGEDKRVPFGTCIWTTGVHGLPLLACAHHWAAPCSALSVLWTALAPCVHVRLLGQMSCLLGFYKKYTDVQGEW